MTKSFISIISFLVLIGCDNKEVSIDTKCNFENIVIRDKDIRIISINDTTSNLIIDISGVGESIETEVPYVWDKDVDHKVYLRKCDNSSDYIIFLFRPIFKYGYVTYLVDILGISEKKISQNSIFSLTLFQLKVESYESEDFEFSVVPVYENEKMVIRCTLDDVIFDRPFNEVW